MVDGVVHRSQKRWPGHEVHLRYQRSDALFWLRLASALIGRPVAWQGRGMADSSVHRAVTVERIAQGVFTATNTRGGQLRFGTGSDTDFTRPNCYWPPSRAAPRSTSTSSPRAGPNPTASVCGPTRTRSATRTVTG